MELIEAKATAAELDRMYSEAAKVQHFHALVISRKGKGKTTLARTCRKPVLIDLFDPNGEQSLLLEDGTLPDWLHVRAFGEGAEEFRRWHISFEEMKRPGSFLSNIGTYVLDSVTNWNDSHILRILKQAGRTKMEIQDWGTLLKEVSYYTKTINLFPCDTLVLGHIKREMEQVTGRLILKVLISGSSDDKMPTIFSEFYQLECEAQKGRTVTEDDQEFLCSDGLLRWLTVRGTGPSDASTRLGRHIEGKEEPRFRNREPANIKLLLEEAGLPSEDLPLLKGE